MTKFNNLFEVYIFSTIITLLNIHPSLVNSRELPSVMLLTTQNFRHPRRNTTFKPFVVEIDNLHRTI
jgi:hypothetical protein